MPLPENRGFSRVKTRLLAEVKGLGVQAFLGWIIDVSVGGVLLESQQTLPLYQACTVTVLIDSGASGLRVTAHGEVVRLANNAVAIEFVGVERDSFPHLVRLISHNSKNPDRILEEIHDHLSTSPLELEEPMPGDPLTANLSIMN